MKRGNGSRVAVNISISVSAISPSLDQLTLHTRAASTERFKRSRGELAFGQQETAEEAHLYWD